MKKNFRIKALILMVVLAMTTGCIKVETGMNISATKNVDIFYNMGMMDSLVGAAGPDSDSFKSEMRKLEDDGFKVSEYKEGGYTGIKGTKSIGKLDDLCYEGEVRSINLDKADENTKYFKVERGFLKNTYTAKFTTTVNKDVMDGIEQSAKEEEKNPDEDEFILEETEVETMVDEVNNPEAPVSNEGNGSNVTPPTDDQTKATEPEVPGDTQENPADNNNQEQENGYDLEQIKSMLKVNYIVTLPTKAINSNATKVSEDGKNLEWNLIEWKEGQTIEFTFEAWNITNLLIVGGGALLILATLIIIIVVTKKSKKEKEPAKVEEKPITEVTVEKENAVTPIEPVDGAKALNPVSTEETKTVTVAPPVQPVVTTAPVTLEVPKVEVPQEVKVEMPVEPVTVAPAVQPVVTTAPVTLEVPKVEVPQEVKVEMPVEPVTVAPAVQPVVTTTPVTLEVPKVEEVVKETPTAPVTVEVPKIAEVVSPVEVKVEEAKTE